MRLQIRKNVLCAFFVCCAICRASAQHRAVSDRSTVHNPSQGLRLFSPIVIPHKTTFKKTTPVPAFHVTSPQAFFCRAEFRLEQRTGLPFRFRLGTVEYTNALESK